MHPYIIQEKHKEDFKNVEHLADLLALAFESINISASDHLFDPYIPLTVKQSKNSDDFLQTVSNWIAYICSRNAEITQTLDHLSVLHSLKQNQIEALNDPTIWPNLYLSKPIILQYLKLVIAFFKDNESVNDLLKQLVTLIDIDIMKSGSYDLCFIADHLYSQNNSQEPHKLECRDFLYLHLVIQQILKQLKIKNTENVAIMKYLMTWYLEQLFEQYNKYLYKTNQDYELYYYYTHCFIHLATTTKKIFFISC